MKAWKCRRPGPRAASGLPAVLALLALSIQLILPLVHGPHVHSHLQDGGARASAAANGTVTQDDSDDCSQCPVCQAMQGAAQPLVPCLAQPGVCGMSLVATVQVFGRADAPAARAFVDASPRGPPAPIAC